MLEILDNPEIFNFIVEAVWEYHLKEKEDTDYITGLKKQLTEVEKAQANLLKAIEAGIFNAATKSRMDELDAQRQDLMDAIAGAELSMEFEISKDYIKFFLSELRDNSRKDPECVKTLIDTFVNAVFVYDDKVTITFNYSGDNRTITLAEIDAAENSDSVRMQCVKDHHNTQIRTFYVYKNVFAVIIEIPGR